MKMTLAKTLAKEFSIKNLEPSHNLKESAELSLISLAVNVHVPNDTNAQAFAISFQVKAVFKGSEYLEIDCDYWAFFESEQELSAEFLESHFTKINAPAIAYPYLRSFITNVLVSAGYPAVYLPTVNFVEMAKD
jgi:preprotein translocase subunit SecB